MNDRYDVLLLQRIIDSVGYSEHQRLAGASGAGTSTATSTLPPRWKSTLTHIVPAPYAPRAISPAPPHRTAAAAIAEG
jgi:hypothetical protein